MTDRVSADFELNQAVLAAQVGPILQRQMRDLTRKIANQARQRVPVRTGNLGRSILEDPVTMAGPFRVEGGVTAHAHYAAAVEKGTRPHVIRARNADALHFKVGGRDIFAREVHHPGTRPRPFLQNAADQVIAEETRG
ncbi:tail assembly chaperone [Gordonia phage Mariokart]|nr:tail assembly chaperone [Gordonia phage Mariokart]